MVSHEVKGCFSESCSRYIISLLIPFKKWRVSISETSRFHYTMSMMYQALSLQDDNMFAIPTTCLGQCMKLPISRIQNLKLPTCFPPEVQWSKHLKTQTITFKHVEILWNFHDISMDFIEDLFFLDPPKRIKKEPGGTWNRSSDPL